ncbi:MAG: HAMP domain-containing sensor histidine kinase [Planctomycetota bacterium]
MAQIVVIAAKGSACARLAEPLERAGHGVAVLPRPPAAAVDRRILDADVVLADAADLGALPRTDAAPVGVAVGTSDSAPGAFEWVPLRADDHLAPLLAAVQRAACLAAARRDRDQARARLAEVLDAMATIADSAASLHHEIRNPISGVTQALRAVAGQLGVDDHAVLHDFQTRLRRIDRMMTSVLQLATPTDIHLEDVPLAGTLERVAHRFSGAPHGGPAVVVRLAKSDLAAIADPKLLETALEGLVASAVAACGPRGRVELRAAPQGDGVVLSVLDDGPSDDRQGAGSASNHDDPFDLFARSGRGEGGVLALARRRLEAMGGRLELELLAGGARLDATLRSPGAKREECAE